MERGIFHGHGGSGAEILMPQMRHEIPEDLKEKTAFCMMIFPKNTERDDIPCHIRRIC